MKSLMKWIGIILTGLLIRWLFADQIDALSPGEQFIVFLLVIFGFMLFTIVRQIEDIKEKLFAGEDAEDFEEV